MPETENCLAIFHVSSTSIDYVFGTGFHIGLILNLSVSFPTYFSTGLTLNLSVGFAVRNEYTDFLLWYISRIP